MNLNEVYFMDEVVSGHNGSGATQLFYELIKRIGPSVVLNNDSPRGFY